MRLALLLMTTLASGCVTAPGSLDALCTGTSASRDAVARDVLTAPDVPLVISAADLVLQVDAACGK